VALEGILQDGRLEVLAIFDKPDPLAGPYFEETYYITPSRHDRRIRSRIMQRVAEACRGLGLREGPVHAEVRIRDGDAVILEVASRTIGGDCARLLHFGTGQGLEDLVISHAMGDPLPLQRQEGGAGVLMIPIARRGILRRIEGILQARAVPHIEEIVISIREGYELVPLPEGASYLGFMFARAPTPALAESALRAAHAKLNVVVAPVMALADERGVTA
jgi:biotin carboxylase